MRVKNQRKWEKWVAVNSEGYSKAVIEFAIAWADRMEQEMVPGLSLASIWRSTSKEVIRGRGLSGFQFEAACASLRWHWVHGDELRECMEKK